MKDIYVITAGDKGLVIEAYESEEDAMLAAHALDEERYPTTHYVDKCKLILTTP